VIDPERGQRDMSKRADDLGKRSVNEWLRKETQQNLSLLTKLREKLEASLEERPDIDPGSGRQRVNGDGKPMWIEADLNERGTPSRDWCRGYARYHGGYTAILVEERERYKMRLLAHRAGFEELTDDEFNAGLAELANEALNNMAPELLEAVLARRRQAVAALAEGDPDARPRDPG
jgi:hypothetical protein